MGHRWLLGVVVPVLSLGLMPSASAADLYGDSYRAPDHGYEDDYYSRKHSNRVAPYSLDERDHAWRDDQAPYAKNWEEQYDRRRAGRRYAGAEGCISKRKIRRRLKRNGWVDFERLDRVGDVVTLEARRAESGLAFILDVDRCTGALIEARPRNGRPGSRWSESYGWDRSRADVYR